MQKNTDTSRLSSLSKNHDESTRYPGLANDGSNPSIINCASPTIGRESSSALMFMPVYSSLDYNRDELVPEMMEPIN
jgi:hypothetical protein